MYSCTPSLQFHRQIYIVMLPLSIITIPNMLTINGQLFVVVHNVVNHIVSSVCYQNVSKVCNRIVRSVNYPIISSVSKSYCSMLVL